MKITSIQKTISKYDLGKRVFIQTIKKAEKTDIGRKAFFPVYENAKEKLKKVNINKPLMITVEYPRHPEFHDKIFALARLIVNKCSEKSVWYGKTEYAFIKAIQMEYGFVDYGQKLSGEVFMYPSSISFEKMKPEIFEDLYSKVELIAMKILKCSLEDIRENYVFEM